MPGVLVEQHDGPPVKKQKLSATNQELEPSKSRIFAPFRTVGLVSPTQVPFASTPLGKTSFHLTTSTGRCLQTYDIRRGLNLVFLTRPQTPGPITATSAWSDQVLAAWSLDGATGAKGIWIFKRGKKVGEITLSTGLDEDIVQIIVQGTWIIGCCSTRIEVWSSSSLEHHTTIWPPFASAGGENALLTGGIAVMPTFANKVFAGREDGGVEIWNVSNGRLIYRILPSSSGAGAVSALEPAPALSLLAIAYIGGLVSIHNVETDQELIRLHAGTNAKSPITSISFRTDGLGAGSDGRQAGIVATASFNSGDVTLWDLNGGGKRVGTLYRAHAQPSYAHDDMDGGVGKVEFLSGQAVLVTSGADNSLKSWIFDETPFSPIPRILHSRTGHAAPITTLNFLPTDADGAESDGKWLLSTGKDRSLWGWSLRRDGQSTELSQGPVQKKAKRLGMKNFGAEDCPANVQDLKAPEITCLACSLNRDGGMGTMPGRKDIWASSKNVKRKPTATEQNLTGWESIVTGHKKDKFARTWFWGRKRAGRWLLETVDGGEVTSVAMSPCGTFALVGSSLGGIDMFNLQSGLHRQRFPARLIPAQARRTEAARSQFQGPTGPGASKPVAKGLGKHNKAVTGIQVDKLNRVVASCDLDGKVKFWDFHTGHLLDSLDWSAHTPITSMILYRPSSLISLAFADHTLRVVDLSTHRVVREFSAPEGRITDHAFSPDGCWLLCSSADRTIRVWDLPTGHLIDAIRLPSICTALAFSTTGDFLATAFEDSVGVGLWTNRTFFTHVPTRPMSESEIVSVAAPNASGEGGENVVASALASSGSDDESIGALDGPLPSVEQLSDKVTTLSLVPRSRWQTLLHLDLIRARNKPIEPPKAPEKAPFFLPALGQPGSRDAAPRIEDVSAQPDAQPHSRILKNASSTQSTFSALLAAGSRAGAFDDFIDHLKTLPPAAADLEIRGLSAAPPYEELVAFLEALTGMLRRRRDYELVQAWMAVWLRCFGEVVGEAVDAVSEGMKKQREEERQGGETLTGAGVFESSREEEKGLKGSKSLVGAVREWRREQRREAERLNGLVGYCAGIVGFLRGAR